MSVFKTSAMDDFIVGGTGISYSALEKIIKTFVHTRGLNAVIFV